MRVLMALFSIKSRVPVAACGIAAALAVGATAGVALADSSPNRALAPYAQASAKVFGDGTRDQSKGIKSVSKPAAGTYCIEFDDPRIDLKRSTPVATGVTAPGRRWPGHIMLSDNVGQCGNGVNALVVYTGNVNALEDMDFNIVVP